MSELLQLYIRRVKTLIAQLDADLERRRLAPDSEWHRATSALQHGLDDMSGMSSEELDFALVQQRSQLAQLGGLYLQASRSADS